MNDKTRFLTRLQKGPVSVIDFLAPNVVDGLKPITRLAARKYDLIQDGHDIREIGTRNGCSVYGLFINNKLVKAPRPTAVPEQPMLFEMDQVAA
jgi:hypothetical protein